MRILPASLAASAVALTVAFGLALAAATPAAALPAPGSGASGDAEVAFALGLAAYHRGDYREAVDRFAAAVAADPDDGAARAWLERARIALERGEIARAPVARSGEGRNPPPWEVEVSASLGEDSNPLLLADGVLASSLDGRFFTGPQSDRVARFGARAAWTPVAKAGGWTVGVTGSADHALYDDLDFLDFTRVTGAVSFAYGGDPAGFLAGPLGFQRVTQGEPRWALLLQAGATSDRLDGERYADAASLAGSLFLREGPAARTRVSLSYRDEEFADDGTGVFAASGTTAEAALAQTFFFAARDRTLTVEAAAGERDAGAAFEASSTRLGAELALPFAGRWRLVLAGGRERIDFDGVESNPLFGLFPVDEAREDTRSRAVAALTWAATPRLLLTARVDRTDRDSDVGPVAEEFFDLDYDRVVASLGLRWFFLGGGR